jgi:hypothetical protein
LIFNFGDLALKLSLSVANASQVRQLSGTLLAANCGLSVGATHTKVVSVFVSNFFFQLFFLNFVFHLCLY